MCLVVSLLKPAEALAVLSIVKDSVVDGKAVYRSCSSWLWNADRPITQYHE